MTSPFSTPVRLHDSQSLGGTAASPSAQSSPFGRSREVDILRHQLQDALLRLSQQTAQLQIAQDEAGVLRSEVEKEVDLRKKLSKVLSDLEPRMRSLVAERDTLKAENASLKLEVERLRAAATVEVAPVVAQVASPAPINASAPLDIGELGTPTTPTRALGMSLMAELPHDASGARRIIDLNKKLISQQKQQAVLEQAAFDAENKLLVVQESLTRKQEELTTQRSDFLSRERGLQDQIAALVAKLEEVELRASEAESSAESKSEIIDELNSSLQDLTQASFKLEERLAERDSDNIALREQLNAKLTELDDLGAACEILKDQVASADSECDRLNQELIRIDSEHSAELQESTETLLELQDQVVALQNEVGSLQRRNRDLIHTCTDKERELQNRLEEYAKVEQQLHELCVTGMLQPGSPSSKVVRGEVELLKQKLRDLESELSSRAIVEAPSVTVPHVEAPSAETSSKLAIEVSRLQSELDAAQFEISQLLSKISELETTIEVLTGERDNLKLEMEANATSLVCYEDEIQMQMKTLAVQSSTLEQQSEAIKHAMQERTDLMAKLATLNHQLEAKEKAESVHSLASSVSSSIVRHEDLSRAVRSLKRGFFVQKLHKGKPILEDRFLYIDRSRPVVCWSKLANRKGPSSVAYDDIINVLPVGVSPHVALNPVVDGMRSRAVSLLTRDRTYDFIFPSIGEAAQAYFGLMGALHHDLPPHRIRRGQLLCSMVVRAIREARNSDVWQRLLDEAGPFVDSAPLTTPLSASLLQGIPGECGSDTEAAEPVSTPLSDIVSPIGAVDSPVIVDPTAHGDSVEATAIETPAAHPVEEAATVSVDQTADISVHSPSPE